MDKSALKEKISAFISKYRFAVLILAIGLILMVIPGRTNDKKVPVEPQPTAEPALSVSQELAQILSQISGAGKVSVMLTVSRGEETLFQTDEDQSSGTSRSDTVIITDENRAEDGIIRQVNSPVYRGAIIVCQGADSPAVRLAIVEAVSGVTGLGADKISVLKMK